MLIFLFLTLLAVMPAHACEGFLPPVHPTGWATGIVADVTVTPDTVDSIVTHITLAVKSSFRNTLPDTVTFSSAGGTILGGNQYSSFAARLRTAKMLMHPWADPPDTAIPGQSFSVALGEPVFIAYYLEDGRMKVYDLCLTLYWEYRDLLVENMTKEGPFSPIPPPDLVEADPIFKAASWNVPGMVTYRTFSPTVYQEPDPAAFDSSMRSIPKSERWLYYRSHLIQPKEEGPRLDSLITATEQKIH